MQQLLFIKYRDKFIFKKLLNAGRTKREGENYGWMPANKGVQVEDYN